MDTMMMRMDSLKNLSVQWVPSDCDVSAKPTFIERLFKFLSIITIILFPFSLILCLMVVQQYKRAIILRFGKLRNDSPCGPGIIFRIPCIDSVFIVDLRTRSFNLDPQEILTKDSVSVTVDAVVYYHVKNPTHCLLNVQLHQYATELLANAILRNVIGQHSLTDLLTNRKLISVVVREDIDKSASVWGVEVERLEIKEVFLPKELQKAMAAEAEGTRIAKAKIIEAEGEIKAAESLRDASHIIESNPKVLLLRYLQTLNYIASENQTSVIFPFPLEIPDSQGNVIG